MKQMYLILALVLSLVLVVGSPAFAGSLPWEDTDLPGDDINDGVDGGGLDDDHPWGGDRIVGGGETVYDKYVRISAITGSLSVDLFLNGVVSLIVSQEFVAQTRTTYATWEKRSPASRKPSYRGRSYNASIREEVGR